MSLICKEDLLRDIEDTVVFSVREGTVSAEMRGANKVIDRIHSAPAVSEVLSRWKYYHKQGKAVCMNCSFERNLDDNFGRAVACPNCGAKMG